MFPFQGWKRLDGSTSQYQWLWVRAGSKLCHGGDTSVGLHGQVIQRVRHDRELQRWSLVKIMLFKGILCIYAVQKATGILKDGKRKFSMKL